MGVHAETPHTKDFEVKAMYVDFRTEVHTVESLKALARQVADAGFNAMIMEYEATFPFEKHATLKNRYAFTKDEIRDLVAYCGSLGLDVIPLQNCMGHAQYILRHDRYAALREDPKDMSQVCPMEIEKARPVFKEIFGEVAALHPSRYFHIGCDETFLLGSCDKCREYSDEHGKSSLFVGYVNEMCAIVREMGKIPVIWADIILKHPECVGDLPDDLVFIDWNYGWDVNRFGKVSNLTDAGVKMWGATALRSGPDNLYLTQWKKHFDNLRDFVPHARQSGYTGMVQTSWSTSGAYSYNYNTGNEVMQMFPTRSVYPESGFNILIAATSWAFNHEEPLDPEAFVHEYAKEKYGFDDRAADVLWKYFCMPQNRVSTVSGKDADGVGIADLVAQCKAMRKDLDSLRPKSCKSEIDHFKLMLDIRTNYLEFKECEYEFESPSYSESDRAGLAARMDRICQDGEKIDRRLARLNRHYLKPGEIEYLKSVRGDKMNAFLKALTADPS